MRFYCSRLWEEKRGKIAVKPLICTLRIFICKKPFVGVSEIDGEIKPYPPASAAVSRCFYTQKKHTFTNSGSATGMLFLLFEHQFSSTVPHLGNLVICVKNFYVY